MWFIKLKLKENLKIPIEYCLRQFNCAKRVDLTLHHKFNLNFDWLFGTKYIFIFMIQGSDSDGGAVETIKNPAVASTESKTNPEEKLVDEKKND